MAAQEQLNSTPWRDEQRWRACRQSAGISAEDKLAWWFLWELTRGCRRQSVTTAEAVGEDQGTKADAGRKRLKNLCKAELIVAEHDKQRGTWLIQHVADPLEIQRERELAKRAADPQRDLPFSEEGQRAAMEAAAGESSTQPSERELQSRGDAQNEHLRLAPFRPPADERPDDRPDVRRRRAPLPSVRENSYKKPLPSVQPSVEPQQRFNEGTKVELENGVGRSSGRSAMDDRPTAGEPRRIGAMLAGALLPSPGAMAEQFDDEQQRIEALAQAIHKRVNCPKMRISPCLKIARLIIEHRRGANLQREVQIVLGQLDQARVSRSAYANGAFNRLRRQYDMGDE